MSRPPPLIWLALVCLAALSVAPLPRPALAQPGVSIQATAAFAGNYMPGMWLPIEVSLTNGGQPREVLVAVALPETTHRLVQRVELPAGAEKRLTLYTAMMQPVRSLRLTVEEAGTVLAETSLDVRPRSDERLLAVVAAEDPRLALPRREDLRELPFTAVGLVPEALPPTPLALSSLGLIVLNALPANGLTPDQAAALIGWVSAGGHLFVGGTIPADGLPPELAAATPGAPAQVPDAPLAALAGVAGPGPLVGVTLTPAPDTVAAGPAAAPAWATLEVGLGAVTRLAFDPGLPTLQSWPGAPRLWDALLRPPRLNRTALGLTARIDMLQEQVIGSALSALPSITLPPADIIFAILAGYAMLIGPGVALLLRRRDRQAWAWAVVPVTALVVAGVVFALAVALRPDQRLVNQLSLVEQLGGGQARVRTYVALMTPQAQSLTLSLPSAALTRPLSSLSGLYGSVNGAGGDLAQEQPEVAMDVAAWKLEGVVVEQQLPLAGVTAAITVGETSPQIEVRNEGDQVLRATVAFVGEQMVFLGDIEPGQTRTARWPSRPTEQIPFGTPISALALRDALETGQEPGQAPQRSMKAREALINAAVLRGDSETDSGPLVLTWLDRSPGEVTPQADEAASQSLTLLTIRPGFGGSGPVTLPNGWLRPDLSASGRSPCFGGQGAGLIADQEQVTATLRLPSGFGALRADELTLSIDSSEDWPSSGVRTALYDWGQGAWVEQSFDGPGDLKLADGARWLRGGELLLRFAGRIAEARCLYISATVRGALP